MSIKKQKVIKWIGLGKVSSIKDNDILKGGNKAYVNILGLSKNKFGFRNQAKNKLNSIGLELIRMEGAEPFKDRRFKYQVSREILLIAKQLSIKNNLIEFSTFHTYD